MNGYRYEHSDGRLLEIDIRQAREILEHVSFADVFEMVPLEVGDLDGIWIDSDPDEPRAGR